jgi:MarR family transcriptional regulator, lower aerobic nicotinate degradation pathway regulator
MRDSSQNDEPAFAAMPGHLVRRAQQIAVALFVEECGGFDITPVQYAALAAILAHPGIDATRLAGLIALDKPTTGGVVDRLAAKGLVARNSDATDRRSKQILLTADGKRLLKRAEPAVDRTQARLLAPLKSADRKTFTRLLRQLVESNNAVSRAPHRPLVPSPTPAAA